MPSVEPLLKCWRLVDERGFTRTSSLAVNLAVQPQYGRPYIAYADTARSLWATATTFDGQAWSTIGPPHFWAAEAAFISLALEPGGAPVVAYSSWMGYQMAVARWDGKAWVNLGRPGFNNQSDSASLAIDQRSGDVYLGFSDYIRGVRAAVMRYNGGTDAWDAVGKRGFSEAAVSWDTLLRLDSQGTPHIFFRYSQKSRGAEANVMRYNDAAGAWEYAGAPPLTPA